MGTLVSNHPVTEAEAYGIDRYMEAHTRGHALNDSPPYWTCDPSCRVRALQRAVQRMIDARED